MGAETTISWCDSTFNPWIGCAKVSAGCANCYAEALMDKRWGKVQWGPNGTRQRTSESNWREPEKWNREAAKAGVRRRVFCASLADVFEDRDDVAPWREMLFNLIDATPHLDWLMLTKRPENIGRMTGNKRRENWWLGASVEDQAAADNRIPDLLHYGRALAPVIFLSCEPLLGPLQIEEYFWSTTELHRHDADGGDRLLSKRVRKWVDWVIIGGESGHGARSMNVEWARDIVRQCRNAGVAPFVKQLGASPYVNVSYPLPAGLNGDPAAECIDLKQTDSKGGNVGDWPEDLRIREFPTVEVSSR